MVDTFTLEVTEEQNGSRIDSFLATQTEGVSRSYLQKLIAEFVFDNSESLSYIRSSVTHIMAIGTDKMNRIIFQQTESFSLCEEA